MGRCSCPLEAAAIFEFRQYVYAMFCQEHAYQLPTTPTCPTHVALGSSAGDDATEVSLLSAEGARDVLEPEPNPLHSSRMIISD
eukprot:5500933-Amphidinium_carterae.1